MQKIITLVVLIAATASAATTDCPKICPALFSPVCAYDGENFEQFSNLCMKKAADCKKQLTSDIVDLNLCGSGPVPTSEKSIVECPSLCTMELNQVCAFDGENYVLHGNPCLKRASDCENKKTSAFVELSHCGSEAIPNNLPLEPACPVACTQELRPVCAYDGEKFVQYSNPCKKATSDCEAKKTTESVDIAFCTSKFVDDVSAYVDPVDAQDPDNECNAVCNRSLEPVCISNGQVRAEMSNKCVAENFNCLAKQKDAENVFRIIKEDSCPTVTA